DRPRGPGRRARVPRLLAGRVAPGGRDRGRRRARLPRGLTALTTGSTRGEAPRGGPRGAGGSGPPRIIRAELLVAAAETVLLDLVADRAERDPEELGRVREVAVRPLERGHEVGLLDRGELAVEVHAVRRELDVLDARRGRVMLVERGAAHLLGV